MSSPVLLSTTTYSEAGSIEYLTTALVPVSLSVATRVPTEVPIGADSEMVNIRLVESNCGELSFESRTKIRTVTVAVKMGEKGLKASTTSR